MFVNLPSVHAIHNHVANRTREVVGEAIAAFRSDVTTEQARGTGLKRRTGNLFDSTKTTTSWGARRVVVSTINAAKYAPAIEFGARPHVIQPRNPGGILRFFWGRLGRWVALRKVNHPGNRTYNFLRRAVGIAGERMGYSLLFAMDEIARRF